MGAKLSLDVLRVKFEQFLFLNFYIKKSYKTKICLNTGKFLYLCTAVSQQQLQITMKLIIYIKEYSKVKIIENLLKSTITKFFPITSDNYFQSTNQFN